MVAVPNNLAQTDSTGKLPTLMIPSAAIILAPGLDASKPAAAAANNGWLYFATDTGLLYRSTGSVWTAVQSGPVDVCSGYPALTLTSADGEDLSQQIGRACIFTTGNLSIPSGVLSSGPLTATLTKNGVSTGASLSLATSGALTISGFGSGIVFNGTERVGVTLTGTQGNNAGGLSYIFLSTAVAPFK